MKTLPLILVLGLALGGCSKSPSNESRSFQRVHPDMQVVIENGADRHVTQPQLEGLKGDEPSRCHYVGTLRLGDGSECSARIEYRGTQSDKDYYWVTLTVPPGVGQVPAPAEIAYDGREIELWKEAGWRVRMCPVRSGEPDGAAPKRRAKFRGRGGSSLPGPGLTQGQANMDLASQTALLISGSATMPARFQALRGCPVTAQGRDVLMGSSLGHGCMRDHS